MVHRHKRDLTILLTGALFFSSAGYGLAYDSIVVSNLNRTRDALLDQRSHLLSKADDIKRSISELERKLNIVNGYVRDTDKALRDVDDAIRAAH